ncbi:protein disulfide isomerase, putative [Entamoeba dispar SAW760]|uniref:Protein disulfide isomerase, putative n=1 Tax=Entamoeba dispar (strain ATCC PRA-260 / SAW760) TaxID=370354 RepID=B0ETT0_ENTDS|nr:protein disulfide isomerase, putative [Entamoeba dispar SAW760]EDR22006.1 protein disulfide isomerase, putative [Entamoeba dispar SAW760]|eukprot:EDR22006.1 protein disulfide isomerase, putative [Entamoeba dispar SAW760]
MLSLFLTLLALTNAHFFGDAPIYMPQNMLEIKALESSSSATILMLYAPWCGHCKHLAPEFASAAKEINGKTIFAAVDCEEHRDICGSYGVQGFPTVKLFDAQQGHQRRTPRDYNGPREARAISGTMYSMIPDWIETIPTELNKDENSVILFSDKPKRTLLYKALAMHLNGVFKFYDCNKDNEQTKKFGVEQFPTILIQHKGEIKKYEGKMDLNSMLSYLSDLAGVNASSGNEQPEKPKEDDIPYVNVHVLNDEMFKKQCNGKACLLLIFGEEENNDLIDQVSKGLDGKMHTLSFTCSEQNDLCNKLNVFFDTPTALIYIPQRGRLIRFVGGFDAEEVVSFAKNSLIGRAGRIETLKDFPSFKDRVKEPYVAPKYEEEEL